MRPSDAFGRPRPVAAVDADATATKLTSGTSGPVGNALNNTGVSGPGIATAPMMTYFLADENDVDAALEAAGRDAESFRTAMQNAPHIRGKATAPTHSHPSAPKTTVPPATASLAESLRTDNGAPSRPATPEAQVPHGQRGQAHTHSTTSVRHSSAPISSMPPTFSPMLSQSGSTSLFGTPGPASLSAMSSPSSRRNSLGSSFLMDDHLSNGGDGTFNPHAGLDMESSAQPEPADFAAAGDRAAEGGSFLLSSSSPGLSTVHGSTMMESGSAPQLIMPSIKMPSRRPFTDMGKSMGRLKVLIAGDTGVGKTSLIKAIVQSCPHIVHVDHISPPSFSLGTSRRSSIATAVAASSSTAGIGQNTVRGRRKSSRSSHPDLPTSQISEIYASTKPYPPWWNELSEDRGPRRRKSLGDNVLDRNICFVDTPGFTGAASPMDTIMPVVEHVEGHLHRLCSNSLSDADLVSLVSGDGGTTVDAVFYLVSGSLKPADIEFLRRLTPLTNVIPLLAQADLLSSKEMAQVKERIACQLHEASIKPFVFTVATENHELALALPASSGLPQPYAVSSASGSDHDVMDASLLMSPDYVQPLVATDLSLLVEQVFCQDGVSRLRHAAARKIAQWRTPVIAEDDSTGRPSNDYAPRPQSLYRPLSFGGNNAGISGSGLNELGIFANPANTAGGGYHSRPGVLTAPLGAPSSFSLARMTDHTQREEQLAQIRLANWAAELQRSLDNERARYEKLARSERALWLTERLGECVKDGTLVAVPPAAANAVNAANIVQQQQQHQARKPRKSGRRSMWAAASGTASASSKLSLPRSFSQEDPLGLLEVTAGLRARSLFVLEVLGSLGVLGSLAVWMANHNYHLQLYEWVVEEWTNLWNGEH